jgi:hypothetical protein
MKKTLIIAVALLFSIYCKAQKEKIQLNLVKGETYSQRMNSDLSITQDLEGQSIVIKMNVFGKMSYKVTNIIDTIYDMEVKYESLGMKMDMQGNTISYSSENTTSSDQINKIMRLMTTKSFIIRMSKKGKIVEVKNIGNLFDVFNGFTGITDAQKQELKAMMAESYGETTFKGNVEMSSAIFPSTPVAKGESWKTKTKIQSKMSMDIENTFTLKEITDSYYILTSSAKLTPDPKADFVVSNGIEMKYNLTGTMTGEIKIDKKTGWTISGSYDQNLNGITTIKASEKIPGGMELPMKMTNKMSIANN